MGRKDLSEKLLLEYNDVFADICNGLVFKKPGWIKPQKLHAYPTEALGIYNGGIKQGIRDVMKRYKNYDISFLVGIENQSIVDYNMITRMMMYDILNYSAQQRTGKKRRRRKANRLPVISCVLYFGYQKRWKGPRSLFEWLRLPKELENFVNDYKINVIEVAWLSEEERQRLTGDFRILADAVFEQRTTGRILGSKRRIRHVKALLAALSAITGNPRFEEIKFENIKENKVTMRNLMEGYNNQLIAQGDKQGFERGQKQGFENGQKQGFENGQKQGFENGQKQGSENTQKTIAHRMLKKFSDMPEMIAEMTGLSMAEIVAIQQTMTAESPVKSI